ncbi:MAG: DUF6714 family protein [Waterburya sp.]
MNLGLIKLINEVFKDTTVEIPPMTLRAGNAVDSYDNPTAYDEQLDQPTDEYIQQFAYWGLPHLDPVSWHYYLPLLMSYSLRNATKDAPVESGLAVEATLFSLRPPDREPSRFSLLTPEQEEVIVQFLDILAFDEDSDYQEDGMQVLEEYWIPGAIYREKE